MNLQERDLYRFKILKILCEHTNYNPMINISDLNNVIEKYNIEEDQNFLGTLKYLEQKGYIEFSYTSMFGGNFIINTLKVTSFGIGFIEKSERNNTFSNYENDFSKDSMIALQDVTNSTVIINSPNTIINLNKTINNINELKDSLLNVEDKEILINMLKEFTISKKKTKWDKAKEIIKNVVDKGFDVAIAVLPYIIDSFK